MATTTNYGWTTPDDTALVKDGAAAIRTLGSSVDTSVKSLNPGTTAGDLDYYTSATAKARIAIGANGTVLTSNGSVPSWGTVASGENWSLLNAGGTALTGATTVTVSGISAKDKIMVLVNGASSANTDADIYLRLNTDTAANYYSFGNANYEGNGAYAASIFTGYLASGSSYFAIGRMNALATGVVHGYARISGANSSGVKAVQVSGGGVPATSQNQRLYNYGGYYNSSSTISSISIVSSTGNLDAGTVFVYTSA
jgi:hypothetical protein